MSLILFLLGLVALGFVGAPLIGWTAFVALFLIWWGTPLWLWILLAVPAVLFNARALRQRFVTQPLMNGLRKAGLLPQISDTEREALDAGTVWFEGELFDGDPDWSRLLREPYPELTEEERAFLDGPAEEVCAMVDDWEVWQRRDLPPRAWRFLKEKGFFGLIIPREYGGLQFSAAAVSAVIAKLSSRSIPLSITAMLPNSLGPAELLAHYGTDEQKKELLPRLARGDEMPCFALTEPHAGSDATAMRAEGVVFRDDDGELKLRLDWDKRYCTLASLATLIGLAFKLRDPEDLLGKGTEPGITCALIPADTPGIDRGRQHDPLRVPFFNCPFHGRDVVVPVDAIIGGPERAGQGWGMLMEQLAAGRGIMLPAQATAGVKSVARVAGAYAAVRKQFGTTIGRFEGVQEPLARAGGHAYLLEAARRFTCGGLDQGAMPAVVSAIAKYHFTEAMRDRLNDGMDVLGGAGISLGPRNLLGHAYMSAPISITVEGANILTRTLMIFGQGAIRCHPYAEREILSLQQGDLAGFDESFWGHFGHVVRNVCRSTALNLSRGYLARCPVEGPSRRYLQRLSWASAQFACSTDAALALYGGDVKRREILAGRFSDVFSWMYLASATVRRFEAEGRPQEDLPFYRWAMEHALGRIQEGFTEIYRNFDAPAVGWLFRHPFAWWSRINSIGGGPSDEDAVAVARLLQTPGPQRDRILDGAYVPGGEEEPLARLERAFRLSVQADEVLRKIRHASREQRLPRQKPETLLDAAVEQAVITAEERELVAEAERWRDEVIAVDDFSDEEYRATAYEGGWPEAASPAGPAARTD